MQFRYHTLIFALRPAKVSYNIQMHYLRYQTHCLYQYFQALVRSYKTKKKDD